MTHVISHRPVGPLDEAAIKALSSTHPDAAMAEVVAQNRAKLQRLATRILKDRDLASDVVQEVFIKAMREPRFFTPDFRMGAWLYRVTNNLCLNMVRDRRRRSDILDGMQTPRSSAPDQVNAVLDDERHDRVQQAIANLSEHHQRILHERFYEDLSYAEIAEVLDIKLGTVMSRLSRAKTALLGVLDGVTVAEL